MMKLRKVIPVLLCIALVLGTMDFPMLSSAAESGKHLCGTSDCMVCTVADKINALPDAEDITIDNAAATVAQIHDIDRIKGNLSDDEYEEMLKLVDAGNDGSGYGVDVPTKYLEAVDAVTKLNAGGSLYIQKKYDVGDVSLNWGASDATFEIERIDGGSFEPLSVTLADILVPTVGYQADSDGWTNTYPLPAGTYRITETDYNAVTADGEELTTTATYSVVGEESEDCAIVKVENGGEYSVSVMNSYGSSSVEIGGYHVIQDECNWESDTARPARGSKVTVIIKPEDGYTLHSISCTGYPDVEFSDFVKNEENGTFETTFEMPADEVTVEALCIPETIKVQAHSDGNQVSGIKFQLIESNSASVLKEWTSGTEAYELNVADAPLQVDMLYEIKAIEEDDSYYYAKDGVDTFAFIIDEFGTLHKNDDWSSEIRDLTITLDFDKYSKFKVVLVEEIEYGDSLDNDEDFIDFEQTTLNGEKITDENDKAKLLDKVWFWVGNLNKEEISSQPVGEYSRSIGVAGVLDPGMIVDVVNQSSSLKILPRTLDAEDFVITANKVYDGTADAKDQDFTVCLKDEVPGIEKNFDVEISGAFSDSNAGEKLDVDFEITSIDSTNYKLSSTPLTGTASEAGTITKRPVENIDITIKQPEIGKDFSDKMEGLPYGVEGNLTWKKGETSVSGKAEYHTIYTAVMELTPTSNYKLVNDTKVKVNDEEVTFEVNEDGKIVYEKDFTTQKANVTSFADLDKITKENGSSLEDLQNALPDEVKLNTEDQDNEYFGTITWDYSGFNQYVKDKLETQILEITGTVLLPDDIDNGNQISLIVKQIIEISQYVMEDQDGDGKPEPDTDGDGIYEGTKGEADYIPDQDGDGKPEADNDKDGIFDNEEDDKHYVSDGEGGFIPYFFTYEVSDEVLTWTLGGSGHRTFTVHADVEKFEGLLLDGVEVDEKNYSYVSGSTIITLSADYLNSLDVGDYTLVADYIDGSGETTLKVVAAPGTVPETTPEGGADEDTIPGTTPEGEGDVDATPEMTPEGEPDAGKDSQAENETGNVIGSEGQTDENKNVNDTANTTENDKKNVTEATDAEDEKDETAADTGDHSTLYLWMVTAFTAMAALVTSRFMWLKKKNK